MLEQLQGMPAGVRIFLVYGLIVLAVVGLTLPRVVEGAIEAPVSALGVVWMLLLAYVIFTITLVLQRKQAAYPLAVGLATLTVPLIAVMYLSPAHEVGAVIALLVAVVVLGSLLRRTTRRWFVEP
jgi:hypothetical protein